MFLLLLFVVSGYANATPLFDTSIPALGGTGLRHDTWGTDKGMLRNEVIFHPVVILVLCPGMDHRWLS